MALSRELIDILACPKCKGKLELKPSPAAKGAGEKDAAPDAISAFVCRACKLVYPVVDDIPNFIVEEAKPLES